MHLGHLNVRIFSFNKYPGANAIFSTNLDESDYSVSVSFILLQLKLFPTTPQANKKIMHGHPSFFSLSLSSFCVAVKARCKDDANAIKKA
jgi:hypothetical protein